MEVNNMDYLEGLRNIILNELNIGGQEVKEENDDDDGDQNDRHILVGSLPSYNIFDAHRRRGIRGRIAAKRI